MRNAQLYAPDHPLVARNMAGLIAVLDDPASSSMPSVAVGIVGNDLVVADTPMHKVSATMTELIRKLKDNKVERIAFERGVHAGRARRARAQPVARSAARPRATPTRTCPLRTSASAA